MLSIADTRKMTLSSTVVNIFPSKYAPGAHVSLVKENWQRQWFLIPK